jgi:hypothetical protein
METLTDQRLDYATHGAVEEGVVGDSPHFRGGDTEIGTSDCVIGSDSYHWILMGQFVPVKIVHDGFDRRWVL